MLLLLLTLINVTIAHFGVTNTSKNMFRGGYPQHIVGSGETVKQHLIVSNSVSNILLTLVTLLSRQLLLLTNHWYHLLLVLDHSSSYWGNP